MASVYEIVTEKICAMLESGTVPWRKPWSAALAAQNLISRKRYRGINAFLLACTPYTSPYWATYRQIAAAGGHVREGEKSTIVVFWKVDDHANELDKEEPAHDEHRRRWLLRYYRVWNVEQTELPDKVLAKLPQPETFTHDPIEQAEAIVAQMPHRPEIRHDAGKAFYSPLTDRVSLPVPERFPSREEYFSTLYHELGHSTGHPSRLNRESIREPQTFASESYSREELTAEMTAAFLCAEAGISPSVITNQAAYLSGWLAKLRADSRLIVTAASQAQRAADYILNRRATESQETEAAA